MNLMTNFTILFASMFKDAFADLAAKMAEVTVGMGDAIADAMSEGLSGETKGAKGIKKKEMVKPEITAQVSQEVKKMFSGLREQVSSRMPENSPEFEAYFANPAFDQGIAIVDKYDFGRPKITEKLGDGDLTSYLVLLKSGDEKLGKMFQELGQWQQGLPKPPFRDQASGPDSV